MEGLGAIRAGQAYVQIGVRDTVSAGLKQIRAKLEAFGNVVSSIGTKLIAMGTAVTGVLAGAVTYFVGAGDRIAKVAQRLGMTVEKLSELQFAAGLSGVELEVLYGALQKLTIGISKAEAGSESMADAFRELGLNAGYLQTLTADEQLRLIADALSRVAVQSDRVRIATMLFGRAGAGMLNMLQDGSAALDDYAATAAKLGVVWTTEDAKKAEELNDAWDMLKGQLLMISVHIGSALAPALLELAEKLTPLIKWVSDFVERNKELIVTVTKAAVAAIALGAGLWGLSAATTGLSMLIWQVHYISATLMALGALVKNTVLVSFMKLGLLPAKALYTLAKPFQYLSDTLKGLGTLVKNTVLVSLMKLGLLPVRQVSELGGSFGKLWNAVKLVYGYAKWLVLGFGELAVLATALAAAILGVYLAFQVLYPYIIEFINSLPTLWQGIKQVVATLPAQIKEAFTLLSGMFQWVMSWVDKTWTYIKAFAWWLKDRFVFIFKDAFNELVAGLSEIAGTFNTAFGAIVNAVKAGEMELAWRIVTVGMELAWLQALKAMEKALDIFIGRITKVFDDLQRSFADWWWSRTKNMAKAFAQIAIGPGGSEEDRLAAFNAIDEDFNKQRAERLKAEKRIKDRRSARSKGSDAEVAALQQEIAELQEKLKDLATEAETKYKASTAPKRGEGPEEPKHLMPSMPKYVPSTELPAALTKGSLEAAQQVEKNRREQAAWEAKMFNEAKKTSDSLKKIEAKAGVGVM